MNVASKITGIAQTVGQIRDGDRVMVGGFGLRGCPDALVDALVAHGAKELTVISNDLGSPNIGLGKLLTNGQIKALIGTYYNWNPEVSEAYHRGEIQITLIPQGSFAESIRAAGYGIPAYYTLVSAGTSLGEGKETRQFDGRTYKARRADRLGNLTYCKVARNFNPLMAMAAKYTVALVDEIVEPGELDPEAIVTPHIFVDAIVKE